MPFPEVKRVKYNKTPLENVICQLRFPPILEIDSQTPYLFQNKIREYFPIYEEKIEVQQEINAAINIAITDQIVNPMTKVSSNKNHEFVSEDGLWKINLTRTFLSVSTGAYSTWEDFVSRLTLPLDALNEIYQPAFFTRIGLRYVDVFCRSKFGLDECSWKELIQPQFLGILGSDIAENVKEMNSVYEIGCEDGEGIIRISAGLVRKIDTNEECFLMDSDVYTLKKVICEDSKDKLNYLHDRTSRLVRFAITDKLHEGMEPENL